MEWKYILKDGEPVLCHDWRKWARWFETADRRLAVDVVGGARVSTVFLGLDHGFGGKVVLWETLVFGGEHDGRCERYSTREDALRGHAKMVTLVRGLKVVNGGKQ